MKPTSSRRVTLRGLIVSMVLCVFPIGCSTMMTAPHLNEFSAPPAGLVYYLPARIFEITVTHELLDCQVRLDATRRPTLFFDVRTAVSVAEHVVPDVKHGYVIEYEKLSSIMKLTKSTFELHGNGTLKGINVNLDDRTAETLTALVKSAMKIMAMSAGVPSFQSANEEELQFRLDEATNSLCGIRGLVSLREVAANRAVLQDKEASEERKKLAQRRIDELREGPLKLTTRLMMNPRDVSSGGSAGDGAGLVARGWLVESYPSATQLEEWLQPEGLDRLKQDRADAFTHDGRLSSLLIQAHVDGADNAAKPKTGVLRGIVFRQPISGFLTICAGRCVEVVGDKVSPGNGPVLYRGMHLIPQLGTLASLPLENGPFSDNTLIVQVSDAGIVTKVEVSSTAQAEEAAKTLSEGLSTVGQFSKAKVTDDEARKTSRRQEEVDAIQHQINLVKKLAELEDAKKALQEKTR